MFIPLIFSVLLNVATTGDPTFYKDVLPILQQHCQSCHRTGQIGPMPLLTYSQARAKAKTIVQMVRSKTMPPWFAEPGHGRFLNDPSLTSEQIRTITAWAGAGMPAGDPREGPRPKSWNEGWNISTPDRVIRMPKPVSIPPRGDIEYTYEIIPTGFDEDKWVQMSEIRPTSRQNVHHAVV
jgi:hypothetical protein